MKTFPKGKCICKVCGCDFIGVRYGYRIQMTCSRTCQRKLIIGRPRVTAEHKKEVKAIWLERERIKHRDNINGYRDRKHGYYLKRTFGISLESYASMLKSQDGRCAVCGTDKPGNGRGKKELKFFPVDHDHLTGKVRGLLCRDCNLGLGAFSDDPIVLHAAMRYLERHSQKRIASTG